MIPILNGILRTRYASVKENRSSLGLISNLQLLSIFKQKGLKQTNLLISLHACAPISELQLQVPWVPPTE